MPEPDDQSSVRGASAGVRAPTAGFLLHGGRRIPIGSGGVTIGRGDDSVLKLSGTRVSRAHARVGVDDAGGFVVEDLGSRHGTTLNGERFRAESRALKSGDAISLDGELVRFISGDETRVASRELSVVGRHVVRFEGTRLTIGRDPTNEVVLSDPNVSRFHAEIAPDGDGVRVTDLGSRNGTRLNGELVERALVETGGEIGIGTFAITFDGAGFVARDERGALRLDSEEIAVQVKDKRILAATSLAIEPGELVAIIGESGSGKSTLIKALAGVTTPTSGRILVNGEPVAARLTDIGYVPQEDIVHRHLTVAEALRYTARLRLPDDVSAEEIEAAVNRALEELELGEHANTLVGSLSGGQRKRAGVAAELLSRPSLLFLDEPTSGLDPGLETRMMSLLRELANRSRAVAVVTHATKNLALCDKVAVMGRGGELTFYGPPAVALEFFGAGDFDGIYSALGDHPAAEWRRRFDQRPEAALAAATSADGDAAAVPGVAVPLSAPRPAARGRSLTRQASVLTRRYLRLLLRDRRNLALLVGQVPLLAAMNALLFQSGIFDRPGGSPPDAAQLLFLLAIGTIWLGSIDSAREIVKERAVFERESAVGVRVSAYLASKAVVLFTLVAVQGVLMAAIVLLLRPLDAPASDYVEVLALLAVTGFVAIAMGLAISAAVDTEDQAMSFTPLALIPQLLFAGAIVPVEQMSAPIEWLSRVMFAQWSFAGLGTAVDMNDRIAESPSFAEADRFGAHFFDVSMPLAMLVLAVFLVLFLAVTALLLRRGERAGAR